MLAGHLGAELGHDAFPDCRLVSTRTWRRRGTAAFGNRRVCLSEWRCRQSRNAYGRAPQRSRSQSDRLPSEQLAPVGVGAGARHGLGRLIKVIGVHVAKRHDLHRGAPRSLQVPQPMPPTPIQAWFNFPLAEGRVGPGCALLRETKNGAARPAAAVARRNSRRDQVEDVGSRSCQRLGEKSCGGLSCGEVEGPPG